jgi:periplasmic protein TonB
MAASAAPFAAPPRWSRTLAQTLLACAASLALHVVALGGLAWLYRSSVHPAGPTLDLRIASVYLAPAAPMPGPSASEPLPVTEPVRPTAVPDLRSPVENIEARGLEPIQQPVLPPTPVADTMAFAPPVPAMAEPHPAETASSVPAQPGAAVEWRVQDWLAQHRQYPRSARRSGAEGTVWVRFVLDRGGALHGSEVLESSGHAVLDRAALDLLQRASPFPALPANLTLDEIELVLPIEYDLTRAARG